MAFWGRDRCLKLKCHLGRIYLWICSVLPHPFWLILVGRSSHVFYMFMGKLDEEWSQINCWVFFPLGLRNELKHFTCDGQIVWDWASVFTDFFFHSLMVTHICDPKTWNTEAGWSPWGWRPDQSIEWDLSPKTQNDYLIRRPRSLQGISCENSTVCHWEIKCKLFLGQ